MTCSPIRAASYRPDGRLSDEVLAMVREIRMASAPPATTACSSRPPSAAVASGARRCTGSGRTCTTALARTTGSCPGWSPTGPGVRATCSSARDPAVRERILPDLLSGQRPCASRCPNQTPGSDARMMRTRAVADGDDWVLSGSKIWITNGPYAEYAVVFARVDSGSEDGPPGPDQRLSGADRQSGVPRRSDHPDVRRDRQRRGGPASG